MSYEADDSFSIWVGEQWLEIVNEFDSYYRLRRGSDYVMGREIKRAMELQLTIDKTLEEAGLELDERGRKAYLRQLILDDARKG